MSKKAIYLGGGAYASITKTGDLVITADHHEPNEASSAVYIEKSDIKLLAEFIKSGACIGYVGNVLRPAAICCCGTAARWPCPLHDVEEPNE